MFSSSSTSRTAATSSKQEGEKTVAALSSSSSSSSGKLFATTTGCQLVVDRIVGYCSTIDILRMSQCSRSLHLACSHPNVWRSLLATEWAVDVVALGKLHQRSLLRTGRFVPSEVNDSLSRTPSRCVSLTPVEQSITTPRNTNDQLAAASSTSRPSSASTTTPVMMMSSAVTPPRRIADSRRYPLSPAPSPPRFTTTTAMTPTPTTPLLFDGANSTTSTEDASPSPPNQQQPGVAPSVSSSAGTRTSLSMPRGGTHSGEQEQGHDAPSSASASSSSSMVAPPTPPFSLGTDGTTGKHFAESSSSSSPPPSAAVPPSPSTAMDASSHNNDRQHGHDNADSYCYDDEDWRSASVVSEALLRAPPSYDWKALLKLVHAHRVTNWQKHLNVVRGFAIPQRPVHDVVMSSHGHQYRSLASSSPYHYICSRRGGGAAEQQMQQAELEAKIASLDNCIEAQIQSGVCRGQVHHRWFLARDLLHQAQLLVDLVRLCVCANKTCCTTADTLPLAAQPVRESTSSASASATSPFPVPPPPPPPAMPSPTATTNDSGTGAAINHRRHQQPPPIMLEQQQQQQQLTSMLPPMNLLAGGGGASSMNSSTASVSQGHLTRFVTNNHQQRPGDDATMPSSSPLPLSSSTQQQQQQRSLLYTSLTATEESTSPLLLHLNNNDNDSSMSSSGSSRREEEEDTSSSPAFAATAATMMMDNNDDLPFGFLPVDATLTHVSSAARELCQRALGDVALVLLLLSAHGDEVRDYQTAQSLATELTLCLGSAPYVEPNFDFDEAYDQVQTTGSVKERAAFLYRAEFWNGPSFTLKLQQYSVCDCLKFWPERIMREAFARARTEYERLCCQAWMMFDRQDLEGAQRTIEIASSLVQACLCHRHNNNRTKEHHSTRKTPARVGVWRTGTHLPVTPRVPFADTTDAVLVTTDSHNSDGGGGGGGGRGGQQQHASLWSPSYRCGSCRKPIQLSASESFVLFSAGFIGQQSMDAINNYITSLRGCREVGRRAITCNNIGTIYFHFKDYAAAALWHEAAIACNRNYFLPYKNLARCHNAMSNVSQALGVMMSAIRVCRPLPAEAFAERSKYSTVHRELTVTMRVCPRLSYPYRLRAAVLMDQGAHERALTELSQIVELKLDPNDLSLRAVFNRDAAKAGDSFADMRLALTLDPTNNTFLKWLEKNDSKDSPLVFYDDSEEEEQEELPDADEDSDSDDSNDDIVSEG